MSSSNSEPNKFADEANQLKNRSECATHSDLNIYRIFHILLSHHNSCNFHHLQMLITWHMNMRLTLLSMSAVSDYQIAVFYVWICGTNRHHRPATKLAIVVVIVKRMWRKNHWPYAFFYTEATSVYCLDSSRALGSTQMYYELEANTCHREINIV